MNAIHLNTTLISSLCDVLFMSATDIREKSAIPSTTWYTIMGKPSAITIQQLLSIANGLHIPVKLFFSEGDVDIIGHRDDYVTEPYQDCYYNADALQNIIDSHPDTTWQKAADATGVTRDNLRKSLLAVRRTPVTRFLIACDALGINPFDILIDPNPEKGTEQKHEGNDVDKLLDDMRRLSATVEDLASKYKALLTRQSKLENTIREYLGDGIGMAAEEVTVKG